MVDPQAPRGRRVTIRDVAELAGTSVSTVSNALSGQRAVGAATRSRVAEAVRTLGYRPNMAAHTLRTGIHNAIGLVVPDITNPFFAEVARGVEAAAQEQGWSVFLGNTELNEQREQVYLQRLGQAADGILFFPTSVRTTALETMVAEGKHVVVCDERLEVPGAGIVLSDNHAGGRLAAEHLIAAGARHFAMVGGPEELPTSRDRLAGFRLGLAAAGRSLKPSRLVHAPTYSIEDGRRCTAELLRGRARFDAVFAADDFLAIGVIQELRRQGRTVPGDVLVCGFDGIALGEMLEPTLTSVVQQSYQIGTEAARLLLHMISGGGPAREVVLSVGLRAGDTTRRPFPLPS
jgi:LacI family transcriptional regulator